MSRIALAVWVSVISLSGTCLASPPVLSFANRMVKMQNECLARDWAQVVCSTAPSMNEKGDGLKTFGSISAFYDRYIDDGLLKGVSEIKRTIDRNHIHNGRREQTHQQDENLNLTIAELQKFADEKNLSPCARACLATCATSQLLKYDINTNIQFEYQPAYILTRGIGLCRHFSNLAEAFMHSLGVAATTITGVSIDQGVEGLHEWVEVTLGKKKYWMEPQRSGCKFYNPRWKLKNNVN